MGKFLISTVFVLLAVVEMTYGITCLSGSSGTTITMTGCTYCQTTTSLGVATYSCAYSSCSPGTVSYGGYSVVTSCCSTSYCNGGSGSGGGGGGGLTCYYGSTGYMTTQSGCTSCQKQVVTYSGMTASTSYCLTTSCTPGTTSVSGASTTTYCCSTSYCNNDAFGSGSGSGGGGLVCYEGSPGSMVTRSGCSSCQNIVSTGATSSSYSSCLTSTCIESSYSYSGTTVTSYCCSTDYCNDASFTGTTTPAGGLRCYEGSLGSLVSKSGCTSCQKTVTSGALAMSTSSCLSTTCSPSSYSFAGQSVRTLCCSTDNCNGASKRRAALAPLAVFMAANALWALFHN